MSLVLDYEVQPAAWFCYILALESSKEGKGRIEGTETVSLEGLEGCFVISSTLGSRKIRGHEHLVAMLQRCKKSEWYIHHEM